MSHAGGRLSLGSDVWTFGTPGGCPAATLDLCWGKITLFEPHGLLVKAQLWWTTSSRPIPALLDQETETIQTMPVLALHECSGNSPPAPAASATFTACFIKPMLRLAADGAQK
jgi:hypothetical protein